MSMDSVLREIADKRTYAAWLETRVNDATHVFNDPAHREHLLDEAARLWAEADRQEAQLGRARRQPQAHPPA